MPRARSALIMAGGRSERMRAGGRRSHKALRRVHDRPLIDWNIDALFAFGFDDLHVSVSASEPELIRWVAEWRDRADADVVPTISMIVEEEPLGTIGAASRLPNQVTDVVVVNVDNLTDLDLRSFADFHRATGAAASIASHEQPFRIPFGRLELDDDRVLAYVEKPSIAIRVSSGTYVLNRRAIEAIPVNTWTDVPQLIETLLSRGEQVVAYRHVAAWLDVNDETSLATAELLVGSPGWRGAPPSAPTHA